MTKKPLVNALAAAAYIALVAWLMFSLSNSSSHAENTVLIPITIISLFTLSAAMMGYIFVLEPLKLYLDGAKKEGVTLFVTSVAAFGVITIAFVVALLLLG